MTTKFYLEETKGKITLYTEIAVGELAPFKDCENMEEAVQYCKTVLAKEAKEVTFVDIDMEAKAIFVDGELLRVICYYDECYKEMHLNWTGEILEEEEKINCTNCRDRGCLYCEPENYL